MKRLGGYLAAAGRPWLRAACAAIAIAWTGAAWGHEVLHEIAPGAAVVVRLAYADGEPFAYEQYELFAQGHTQPVQTGRTDHKGRVLFASDDTSAWRLRSFSADGHGVDLRFEARADAAAAPAAPVSAESGRAMRLLSGLAVILLAFVALALLLRRRRPA